MSDLRDAARQSLEALEIGYACAEAEAAQYHAAMAGYRPHRHAQMDADVQKIAQAITAIKAALEQPEQTNPWRDAVDHELSTLHMVASDDPRESIRRLIDWHCAVQIDPLVSSAAQELIERGRREALEQPEQERKLTDEVIADLWHQNGGFHHHFARAVERYLKGEK